MNKRYVRTDKSFLATRLNQLPANQEFLSAREVEYESINVADDPEGMADLRKLGARSVPVVSRGTDFIYAQDLNQVARFVELDEDLQPSLSPDALVERLKHILDIAISCVQQIPHDQLQDQLPGRPRSLLSLANHIFEITAGFIKVTRGADFTGDVANATPDIDKTVTELTAYQQELLADLDNWWIQTDDRECMSKITTYYGEQTLHSLLERCTWHTAQHVRQVLMLLDSLDITPAMSLGVEHLADLPLPDKVWD